VHSGKGNGGGNGNGNGNGNDQNDTDAALQRVISQAITQGEAHQLISRFERDVLKNLLKAYRGNRTRVAEDLRISRNTLRAKLKEYGLSDVGGA
jgi:DNA-binding NtrC family response regulator